MVAVDVGYGQLAWRLRSDERVQVHERTNVRELTPEAIGGPAELTAADLSFISLRLVLPALRACTVANGDLLLMVKPQFEVGRADVGRGGVVRDAGLRAGAVRTVAEAAAELGLGVAGVVASPLPGPSGNVEYFLWLRDDGERNADTVVELVRASRRGGSGVSTERPSEREVLLVAHVGREPAVRSARHVAERLGAEGVATRVIDREAEQLACSSARVVETTRGPPPACELVLALGGDGTLLRAAEYAHDRRTCRCWASTSAGSGSWPRPSVPTWPPPSSGSSAATTSSRSG